MLVGRTHQLKLLLYGPAHTLTITAYSAETWA